MKIDIALPNELKSQLDRIEERIGAGPPCPEYITIWQFAQMKGVNVRTVQRWIRQGKVAAEESDHGRVIHRDQTVGSFTGIKSV